MMLVPYKKDYCAKNNKNINLLSNKKISNEQKLLKHRMLNTEDDTNNNILNKEKVFDREISDQTIDKQKTELNELKNNNDIQKEYQLQQKPQQQHKPQQEQKNENIEKFRTLSIKPVENIDIFKKKDKKKLIKSISSASSYTPVIEEFSDAPGKRKRVENSEPSETESEFKSYRQFIAPNQRYTRNMLKWKPY